MSQVLDIRSTDKRQFDLNCSSLLMPTETITSITSISADQGGLTFGTPAANAVPITYADTGLTAAVGKVCQVQINGAALPTGTTFLLCTVRALLVTTLNPALEATVQLRLINTPNI
jgi:hypothetical protein